MIQVRNLSKQYKLKNSTIDALKDVSFDLNDTGLVFIIGKSGSGKTTLLNMLGTLDSYDSGDIIFNGKSLNSFSKNDFNSFRNEYLGFVFQEFNLLTDYTVEENLSLALSLLGRKEDKELISKTLEKVDLKGFEKRKPNELSGGQKQRVAIARALIKSPKLVLCDEPTGALDSGTSKEIFELLKELSKECLIVVVSHDKESASIYGDKTIEIIDGEIVKEELKEVITKEDFKLEKHSLPFKKSLSLSLKFFKKRPIRLAIAMVLALISVTLLSFASTLATSNKTEIIANSMVDHGAKYLSIEKNNYRENNDSVYDKNPYIKSNTYLSLEDVEQIKKDTKQDYITVIYPYFNSWDLSRNLSVEINDEYEDLFITSPGGFTEIDQDFLNQYDYQLHGKLPEKDDELVISDYFFEMFKYAGYTDGSKVVQINQYDDLIGKSISCGFNNLFVNEFAIVGVIDTEFDFDYYEKLVTTNLDNYVLKEELKGTLYNSLHNLFFLNQGFYNRFVNIDNTHVFPNTESSIDLNFNSDYELLDGSSSLTLTYNSFEPNENIYLLDNPKQSEANNGIAIPFFLLSRNNINFLTDDYVFTFARDNYDSIKAAFKNDYPDDKGYNGGWRDYYNFIKNNNYDDTKYSGKTRNNFINDTLSLWAEENNLFEEINKNEILIECNDNTYPITINTVYAVWSERDYVNTNYVFTSETLFKQIVLDAKTASNDISCVTFPFNNVKRRLKEIISYTEKYVNRDIGDKEYVFSKFNIENEFTNSYDEIADTFDDFKNILLLASAGLIIISTLFMVYYFSEVVQARKKEIGILRSMGASKKDIVKIFSFNNSIFALIIIVLSNIFLLAGIYGYIRNLSFFDFALVAYIGYSYLHFLLTFIVTVISIIVGVSFPLVNIMKKKPVEILRSRK